MKYTCKCINAMCHIDIWEKFRLTAKSIIFIIKRTVLVPGVCLCIHIRSIMHYVHIGEAMVKSIKN